MRAVVGGEGRVDILCEHGEEYEALGVEEDGIVSLSSTCGKGCTDLTFVGSEAGVGVRAYGK